MPDMNEEQMNHDETPEDRETRIRAEVDKLTEGKTNSELTSMLANAIAGVGLQSDLQWLHTFNPNSTSVAIPSSAVGETTRSPITSASSITSPSMVQRIMEFRDELEGLLPAANSVAGLEGKTIGKFRQALGNLILWYGQWEQNRDYSSAINASMALGKLSTAADFLQQYKSEGSNTTYDAIIDTVTDICSECWERIGAAGGRIVPFEKG